METTEPLVPAQKHATGGRFIRTVVVPLGSTIQYTDNGAVIVDFKPQADPVYEQRLRKVYQKQMNALVHPVMSYEEWLNALDKEPEKETVKRQILDQMECYLRRCRSGGMPKAKTDTVASHFMEMLALGYLDNIASTSQFKPDRETLLVKVRAILYANTSLSEEARYDTAEAIVTKLLGEKHG